jgi:hypothetical protein
MMPESHIFSCFHPREALLKLESALLQFVSCPHARAPQKTNQILAQNQ